MQTDAELLQRYVRARDERAFEALVVRHLGLVRATACRRLGHRSHLANDVCQNVFTALARRAPSLIHHPVLGAWLHRCTRNVTLDLIRREGRVEKLAHSFAVMSDSSSVPNPSVDWERVRPILDDAIDKLREQDREIIILRYVRGLSFADVGQHLRLKENTARMRANRALERLRASLSARGVNSTSAVISAILITPALPLPSGLAASVAANALASVPTGFAASLVTFLMTSKLVSPLVSGAIAAALTAAIWPTVPSTVRAEELTQLRAENARLKQLASSPTIAQSVQASPPATEPTAVVIAQRKQAPEPPLSPRPAAAAARPTSRQGHVFHGQDTAFDAGKSFAYACDLADVELISKLIWFEPDSRKRAAEILATKPASIRNQYGTPELFYALAIAANSLIQPPPGPHVFPNFHAVALKPGRTAARAKGSDKNIQEYQQTAEGWKYVVRAKEIEYWPTVLNDELLKRLKQQSGQP